MVRGVKAALATCAVAIGVVALPATASADNVSFYPGGDSHDFANSVGGFTGSTEAEGLCVPVLLCPLVTNDYVGSGGTGGNGDGYLSTSIVDLLGVAGESRGIWTGSPFTYRGADGKDPTKVTLTIARRSDLGGLLSVVGNEADYSVELIDDSAGGVATRLIDRASLRPTEGWTRASRVGVDLDELTMGHTYRFRIISRFIYGAAVIQGGEVNYDDIRLTAKREAGAGGGGAKPGGNSAILAGRNLFIKLQCFGVQSRGKCFSRATALKSKGGRRYTFPIQRKVDAKKGKVIRARIRFQFREELESRRSIVLKSVLRTGRHSKNKTTKYKKLTLIKRG